MNSCLSLQPASLPADVELGRANSLNSLPHSLSPSSPRHTHTPLSPVKAKPHIKLTITFTYNTIYPFRCTVLRDLTKLELCSPHENLNKVLQVQTTLCSPSFLPPHSLATTDLFSSLVVLPFAQCHINGIIHYVTFWVQFSFTWQCTWDSSIVCVYQQYALFGAKHSIVQMHHSSSVPQLKVISIVSSLGQLWIKMLWLWA